MNQINRRSFIAGAAFGVAGTVVAAPLAAPLAQSAAAPAAVSDAELIALFAKLSRRRQEEILHYALFLLDRQERRP